MSLFGKKPAQKRPAVPAGQTNGAVIALSDPKSPVAEAYRTVRTNLQFSNLDEAKKSLLVTSAGPGEGKTTTVANLGVTLAMAGARTLVVDTDLRRPTVHKLFALQNASGLTTMLAGQAPADGCIQPTRLANLWILPSGPIPPNPAEMLMSRGMAEFARSVKTRFDMVLYDSPPILSVSDSMILASLVEGVILVVKGGTYPHEVINRAKMQLENVKATVLGVLLNSIDMKRDGYYYQYYYYYYYGYSYGSRDSKK